LSSSAKEVDDIIGKAAAAAEPSSIFVEMHVDEDQRSPMRFQLIPSVLFQSYSALPIVMRKVSQ
jgi:hypothetical protein